MIDLLLSQSLAIRTVMLPEVQAVIDAVPMDHQGVRHYKTTVIDWLLPVVDLRGWHVYPMNGVTEGLNWWSGTETRTVTMSVGDYQWIDPRPGQGGTIHYASEPSAIDGHWRGVPQQQSVALDLAYVGSTAPHSMALDSNVQHVFYSLSKSFGMRNTRTGWYFTREPDRKLEDLIYGAKYYNYHAHHCAEAVLSSFAIDHVWTRLRDLQQRACDQLNLKASDSVWLATSTDPAWTKFRRQGDIARICLAPLYKQWLATDEVQDV